MVGNSGLKYYLSLIPRKSRMERYRGDELKFWEQYELLHETVEQIRESELVFFNDDEPYNNNLITPACGDDITTDYLSTLSPDERDWLIRQLTSE